MNKIIDFLLTLLPVVVIIIFFKLTYNAARREQPPAGADSTAADTDPTKSAGLSGLQNPRVQLAVGLAVAAALVGLFLLGAPANR